MLKSLPSTTKTETTGYPFLKTGTFGKPIRRSEKPIPISQLTPLKPNGAMRLLLPKTMFGLLSIRTKLN